MKALILSLLTTVPPALTASVPWGEEQAAGAPDTPTPGDYSTAWAARFADRQLEWLRLEFPVEKEISAVRIYESYNPGAISKVTALKADDTAVDLTLNPASRGEWTAEYCPPDGTRVQARVIRLEIDEPRVPGWNEIDAAGLIATDGTRQWAASAKASSSFAAAAPALTDLSAFSAMPPLPAVQPGTAGGSWSASQATGEPDTPTAGDRPSAWAPAEPDLGGEWLDATFAAPSDAAAVAVYQSFNPGAIVGIKLYGEGGTMLGSLDPKDRTVDNIEGGIAVLRWNTGNASGQKVNKVRIELDTALVSGWNEIDAVQLLARDGTHQWAATATASSNYGSNRTDTLGSLNFMRAAAGGSAGTVPPEQFSDGRTMLRIDPADPRFLALSEAQSRVDALSVCVDSLSLGEAEAETAFQKFRFIPQDARKGIPWSAEQVIGAPDTHQRGDIPTAWAPKTVGGGEEWLQVCFDQAVKLDQVRIHESNLPGAITSVQALLPGTVWLPLEFTAEEAAPDKPRIVTARPAKQCTIPVQVIRINLDTRKTPDGWPEIDAVELVAADAVRQWASHASASSSYAETYGNQVTRPSFERARTLGEANERLEQMNRRMEALEQRLQRLSGTDPARLAEPESDSAARAIPVLPPVQELLPVLPAPDNPPAAFPPAQPR